MKRIVNSLLLALVGVVLFASCKKDENKIYLEGNDGVTLTADRTGPIVLDGSALHKNDQIIKFDWTNPNFRFTTGVSSQNVNYALQIAPAGSNFDPELTGEIAIPQLNTVTLTNAEFNQGTLAGFQPEQLAQAEIRIKASLVGNADPVYSNIMLFDITPYLDAKYPPPTALYITGSATPASWMGGGDPENLSQKFTKTTLTKFEITLNLNANGSYLFVPVYGDWSHKYGFTGSNNSNSVDGGDFKPEGGDMIAPVTSGSYKITVEFKTGKWTVTPA